MFTIYSSEGCRYCKSAKELLKKHNQTYEEVDVFESEDGLEVMQAIKARTVPQVFHNNIHIGGFEDLKAYLEETHEG